MLAILTINNDLLTRNYGVITKEQTLAAATVYQATQGRDAQNLEILFNFLCASITDGVLAKVNMETLRYVMMIRQETVNDGVYFLKSIIDHTYTKT